MERLKTVYNVSILPGPHFIMRPTVMTWQTDLLRRIDHSTIGSILGAVLIPAILWNRAGIVNCRPSNNCLIGLILILSSDTGRSWSRKWHWPSNLLWQNNIRLTSPRSQGSKFMTIALELPTPTTPPFSSRDLANVIYAQMIMITLALLLTH